MTNTMIRMIGGFVLVLMFSVAAFAQSYDQEAVAARQADIANISKSLDAQEIDLIEARDRLRMLRTEARGAADHLTKQQADVKVQLENLGPAPEQGVPESTDVAARRKELQINRGEIAVLLAQANLNASDSTRLLDGLSTRQRETFLSETFMLDKSPLLPSFWKGVAKANSTLVIQMPAHFKTWWQARAEAGMRSKDIIRMLFGLLVLLSAFRPLRTPISRIFADVLNHVDPSLGKRFVALGIHIILRLVPGFLGGMLLYRHGVDSGLIVPAYQPAAKMMFGTIMMTLVAGGVAKGLFDLRSPNWRLVPVDRKTAARAGTLSVIAVLVWGLDQTTVKTSLAQMEGAQLANGSAVFLSIVTAVLLWLAIDRRKWKLDPERADDLSENSIKRWLKLRRFAVPIIIVITGAVLMGYLNFARLVSTRTILIIGIIVGIWVGRKAVMTGLRALDEHFIKPHVITNSASRLAMLFWAGLVIDGFLLIAMIPVFLLMIGVDYYDVKASMIDAFTGITIGKFTLSLSDIVAGIVTFFVILFVTRFMQKTLDLRLFAKSGVDDGFRNSFRTLLGYGGLIVAIFAAIGVVGLDLSNLAIIAGALSVGIGFGLQSIVNNFVSGLILLFERPVKVGDWVVTSSGEGFVKNISVRSTEIETFDRASIIVPNSELISNSVTNWTHKDKGGRVIVPVGISYSADVKQVREILLQVAAQCDRVLKYPEPFVYFKDFGESSLDVELRVFVPTIAEGPLVKNDLRFDILDAFRSNGIEIPFPQRDVHMNTVKK